MTGNYKGLFSKLFHGLDHYLTGDHIAAGAHAVGGALLRSAQGGLLHNVAALPGAFTGAILRDLQNGPVRSAPADHQVSTDPAVMAPFSYGLAHQNPFEFNGQTVDDDFAPDAFGTGYRQPTPWRY